MDYINPNHKPISPFASAKPPEIAPRPQSAAETGDQVTLATIQYTPTKRGMGVPCWTAWTDDPAHERYKVTLFTEDIRRLEKAGYAVDSVKEQKGLRIEVVLFAEPRNGMWRIAEVVKSPAQDTPHEPPEWAKLIAMLAVDLWDVDMEKQQDTTRELTITNVVTGDVLAKATYAKTEMYPMLVKYFMWQKAMGLQKG